MAWADAALAAQLLAVDPWGLGGLALRMSAGPLRDQVCGWLRALLPDSPMVRVPLHVTDDRLLGGLCLAATLRTGRLVAERGVLADADGGLLVVPMAERVESRVASHLCNAIDRGELSLERDGVTAAVRCRVGVLALDEGLDDERLPTALADRLAFHVDLTSLQGRANDADLAQASTIVKARALLDDVVLGSDVVEALCQAATALGVASLRGPLLAATAARAHAALQGRTEVDEMDATMAARLVLGPRATRAPEAREDVEGEAPPEPPVDEQVDEQTAPPPPPPADGQTEPLPPPPDASATNPPPLEEVVLEAARSGIPSGLLDALALGRAPRKAPGRVGQSGVVRASTQGGRPAGVRAAVPQSGERLNVVETLRAAAPWQPIRRHEREAQDGPALAKRRLEIRKQDFRVTRFQQRAETRVIFSVDASGSAALQRLAEAKGAVEQVLIDCYVRRDHVALVAFRGANASVLLSPTRSLARVRRSLADLAGGGTTPLAAGIDAALELALDATKRGQTPVLVMMTDGRANVAKDGSSGGATATADAIASARAVRAAGVRALFLDTAPRPRPQARSLADAMGARYVPLPYLDAAGISRHVQSLAASAPGAPSS